jgi:hypothetical protein
MNGWVFNEIWEMILYYISHLLLCNLRRGGVGIRRNWPRACGRGFVNLLELLRVRGLLLRYGVLVVLLPLLVRLRLTG